MKFHLLWISLLLFLVTCHATRMSSSTDPLISSDDTDLVTSTSTSTSLPTPPSQHDTTSTPTTLVTSSPVVNTTTASASHRHSHHQIQTEHNEKVHHHEKRGGKRELEADNMNDQDAPIPTLTPRQRKELFVTGHNGTTLNELSLVAMMAPVSYLFRYVLVVVGFTVAGIPYPMQRSMETGGSNVPLHLTNNYGHIHGYGHGRAGPAPTTAAAVAAAVTASAAYRYGHVHAALGWLIDMFTIVVPLFLSLTHVHLIPILLTGMLIISLLLMGIYYSVYGHISGVLSTGSSDQMVALNGTRSVFVGDYRSSLMITTAIAILAVDFPIFPRRFAKTETFGQSLMDIGVGCFLFAHALVSSRRPSLHSSHTTTSVFKLSSPSHERITRVRKLIRQVMPLLILGILRLVTNKATDYQEHVSEYGLHWNFFFTLAAVSLLSELLSWFIHPSHFILTGTIIITCYQFMLSYYGWTDYIMNEPRTNIWNANKEGIASSIGYLSLYLMAVQFGAYLLPTARISHWHKRLVVLILSDALLWILTAWLDAHVQPISRRMVNLSYLVWMLAFNIGMISCFLTINLIITRASTFQSYIQLSISRNALPFFILSNLLTGLVNKSMDTLAADNATATYVLLAYMAICTGIMSICHYRRINLKVW